MLTSMRQDLKWGIGVVDNKVFLFRHHDLLLCGKLYRSLPVICNGIVKWRGKPTLFLTVVFEVCTKKLFFP
jgi:hypothetical protein